MREQSTASAAPERIEQFLIARKADAHPGKCERIRACVGGVHDQLGIAEIVACDEPALRQRDTYTRGVFAAKFVEIEAEGERADHPATDARDGLSGIEPVHSRSVAETDHPLAG